MFTLRAKRTLCQADTFKHSVGAHYADRMRLILALAVLLALPASASAAPTLELKLGKPAVRYGATHTVTGTLTDGTTPLPGQPIVLEGQRYPFQGSFRELARATTGPNGEFAFKPALDRNHKLRVAAPAQGAVSQPVRAYVLPSFELSFRPLKPGVARLYQRYTVPNSVKLSAPTLFYIGSRSATRSSRRVAAKTRRTSAGHFTAIATIHLPGSWKGRFRFGSCFRTSPGSGMGEPLASCPKVHLRF
jgi:hypothetical protein